MPDDSFDLDPASDTDQLDPNATLSPLDLINPANTVPHLLPFTPGAAPQPITQLGLPSTYWQDQASKAGPQGQTSDPLGAKLAQRTADLWDRVMGGPIDAAGPASQPPNQPSAASDPTANAGEATSETPSITLSDYYDQLKKAGISSNMSVDKNTMNLIKTIESSDYFRDVASPIYNSSISSLKNTGKYTEDGAIQAYLNNVVRDPSITAPTLSVDQYGNLTGPGFSAAVVLRTAKTPADMQVPDGAVAATLMPSADPSFGNLLFDWHPHPSPAGKPLPSPRDLIVSNDRASEAGIIWKAPQDGAQPIHIYYEGKPRQ